MENKFFGFISFAILIEAIITYFSEFFLNSSFPWPMLASIMLGITVSVAYNLDLPDFFNLKSKIPYIGSILTGILLSRGSNYIFDLIDKFANIS